MTLTTPAQLERANTLLGQVLADRREIALGDACRDVEHADRALAPVITRRLLSTLLRKRGFAAAGVTGSALNYDRDTLYRKAA